jgi:hypothetical protein
MKIKELMEKYTAYTINDESRDALLLKFPPKYEKVIAHHVTNEFGVPKTTQCPQHAKIKIVGYLDSKDGLETLVVSVNGTTTRPDGKLYHITWSLDPTKYSPKDSNELLHNKKYTIIKPIEIDTTPQLV